MYIKSKDLHTQIFQQKRLKLCLGSNILKLDLKAQQKMSFLIWQTLLIKIII